MKTVSLGNYSCHVSFSQEGIQTDRSEAGNEINIEGVAGVSG